MSRTHRNRLTRLARIAVVASSLVLGACNVGDEADDDPLAGFEPPVDAPYCFTWGNGQNYSWYNYCDGNVLRIDGCNEPIWAADCGDYGMTCESDFDGHATCR